MVRYHRTSAVMLSVLLPDDCCPVTVSHRAFSTFVKYGYRTAADQQGGQQQPGCPSHSAMLPSSQQMAQTAFQFVTDHLRAPGSGLFAWKATRDGSSLVQPHTVLYGQWFVVYAFSQYHTVFGSAHAKQHALSCFRAVSKAWHDSNTGGYVELASNSIPTDTTKEDAPDGPLPRSLNNMMHGLEVSAVPPLQQPL